MILIHRSKREPFVQMLGNIYTSVTTKHVYAQLIYTLLYKPSTNKRKYDSEFTTNPNSNLSKKKKKI